MSTYSNTLLFLGGKLKMSFLLHFGQFKENRPILSIRVLKTQLMITTLSLKELGIKGDHIIYHPPRDHMLHCYFVTLLHCYYAPPAIVTPSGSTPASPSVDVSQVFQMLLHFAR